jgi:hypothetical protein
MEGNTAAKRRRSRRDGAESRAGIEVRPLTGVLIVVHIRYLFWREDQILHL